MNRDDAIQKIVVPLSTATLAASVALFLALRHPVGELTLESVRLSPGDSAAVQFGKWRLRSVADSEYRRVLRDPPELRESTSYDTTDYDSPTYGLPTCAPPPDGGFEALHWIRPDESDSIQGRTAAPLQPNAVGVAVYSAEWQFLPTLPASWQHFTARALVGLDSARLAHPFPDPPPPKHAEAMTCQHLIHVLGDWGHIVQPPVFQLLVRNTGKAPVTVLEYVATPLRDFGGEAGSGGAPVEPVGDRTEIALSWDAPSAAGVHPPINLDPGITTMLEIRPRVEDAASGDGPGWLLFHLSLRFHDGKKIVTLPIGNFLLADDIGALASF